MTSANTNTTNATNSHHCLASNGAATGFSRSTNVPTRACHRCAGLASSAPPSRTRVFSPIDWRRWPSTSRAARENSETVDQLYPAPSHAFASPPAGSIVLTFQSLLMRGQRWLSITCEWPHDGKDWKDCIWSPSGPLPAQKGSGAAGMLAASPVVVSPQQAEGR